MALVTLTDILPRARAEKYAVGAFDFIYPTEMLGILDAAAEARAPVILLCPDGTEAMENLEVFAPAVIAAAKRAPVPVVVQLDHGKTLEACERCVAAGFSSIMIDSSTLPFEENLRITKEVAALCRPRGITVEAELGHVGLGSDYDLSTYHYTDPREAVEFVKASGIDALAVAIGNAHGVYKGKPEINYPVLEELERAVEIPLVLHGGSGISGEDFRKIIQRGVAKINIFTELALGARDRLRKLEPEKLDLFSAARTVRDAFKDGVLEKIRLFGTRSVL
jgi:fructose-bisphosphate aldolase class II